MLVIVVILCNYKFLLEIVFNPSRVGCVGYALVLIYNLAEVNINI